MSEQITTVHCENVAQAASMLQQGLLVAFPTETVYGLGADAKNPAAVARIFEAKQRPTFDPLIVHVPDVAAARALTLEFPEIAERLAAAFWPGPLTMVLPKTDEIPDLVTSGLPGVGIRVPDHPVAQELLVEAGCPLAAPSANPFGGISPTTAAHVQNGLGGRVDGILNGGPCGVGVESTVISLMGEHPTILRPGGLPREDIEAVIGPVQLASSDPAKDNAAQPAPGMLSRHYAPATPLRLISQQQTAAPETEKTSVLLTYGADNDSEGFAKIVNLSEAGDLRTCATKFFAALRSLDSAGVDVIIARSFPDEGLGVALNDRLQRAADEWL